MKLADWRKSRKLSQQAVAIQLGLQSRGRLNTLEKGRERWPVELAIKVERLTEGAVTVAELRNDLHDVRVVRPSAEGAPA